MISFVIPVHRSEQSLPELYERIAKVCERNSWQFEAIFVEHCGGDNSWKVIERLASQYGTIRGFRMSRNYGQHNALLCGIREASGEIIVTLDDDLEHSPEEIPKLIAKLEEGFDVVYGPPPEKEQHGLLRDLASQITKLALAGAMGAANARQASAFRAFRTQLREAFAYYSNPSVNIDVLLTYGTTNYAAVRVRHDERRFNQSGHTSRKLIRHALDMMTAFSTRPLQIASVIDFIVAIFGFALLIYVLIRCFLQGRADPGFAFLASAVAIFSGVQLLALGVIGEYLARMHFRMMERPTYTVKQRHY